MAVEKIYPVQNQNANSTTPETNGVKYDPIKNEMNGITPVQTPSQDEVNISSNPKKKSKASNGIFPYLAVGVGIIALIAGRKKIAAFFEKTFKKGKPEAPEAPKGTPPSNHNAPSNIEGTKTEPPAQNNATGTGTKPPTNSTTPAPENNSAVSDAKTGKTSPKTIKSEPKIKPEPAAKPVKLSKLETLQNELTSLNTTKNEITKSLSTLPDQIKQTEVKMSEIEQSLKQAKKDLENIRTKEALDAHKVKIQKLIQERESLALEKHGLQYQQDELTGKLSRVNEKIDTVSGKTAKIVYDKRKAGILSKIRARRQVEKEKINLAKDLERQGVKTPAPKSEKEAVVIPAKTAKPEPVTKPESKVKPAPAVKPEKLSHLETLKNELSSLTKTKQEMAKTLSTLPEQIKKVEVRMNEIGKLLEKSKKDIANIRTKEALDAHKASIQKLVQERESLALERHSLQYDKNELTGKIVRIKEKIQMVTAKTNQIEAKERKIRLIKTIQTRKQIDTEKEKITRDLEKSGI